MAELSSKLAGRNIESEIMQAQLQQLESQVASAQAAGDVAEVNKLFNEFDNLKEQVWFMFAASSRS